MLAPRASVFLKACTLTNQPIGLHLGLVAMSHAKVAMYDCVVHHAQWGVYAGKEAGVLASYNRFSHIYDDQYITFMYDTDCSGQVVQPWREDWALQRPGGPALA